MFRSWVWSSINSWCYYCLKHLPCEVDCSWSTLLFMKALNLIIVTCFVFFLRLLSHLYLPVVLCLSGYVFFLYFGFRDMQSYISDLSIFLGNKSKKMYIFVDNQPWSNPCIRSAHLWQIVVTNVVTRCLYLFDERYDEVTFISLFFFAV